MASKAKCQKLSILQFEDLPDEIILGVLSFLDIKDLLRCAQTSKRIRNISNDESYSWNNFNHHFLISINSYYFKVLAKSVYDILYF